MKIHVLNKLFGHKIRGQKNHANVCMPMHLILIEMTVFEKFHDFFMTSVIFLRSSMTFQAWTMKTIFHDFSRPQEP